MTFGMRRSDVSCFLLLLTLRIYYVRVVAMPVHRRDRVLCCGEVLERVLVLARIVRYFEVMYKALIDSPRSL